MRAPLTHAGGESSKSEHSHSFSSLPPTPFTQGPLSRRSCTRITARGPAVPGSILTFENRVGRVNIWVFVRAVPDTRLRSSVLGPCSHVKVQEFVLNRGKILDAFVFRTLAENFSPRLPRISWSQSVFTHPVFFHFSTFHTPLVQLFFWKLCSPVELPSLIPPLCAHDFWPLFVTNFFCYPFILMLPQALSLEFASLNTSYPNIWVQIRRYAKDFSDFCL